MAVLADQDASGGRKVLEYLKAVKQTRSGAFEALHSIIETSSLFRLATKLFNFKVLHHNSLHLLRKIA